MPRGRTNKAHKRRQQQQHGGMKFNRATKRELLARGVTELNIIQFLISRVDANDVKVVWDASTYSFIFELTLPPGLELLDPFGLPLADSADTFAAFAAGTPELETPVTKVCAKMSFVYDADPSQKGAATHLLKDYHGKIKNTTTTENAYKEADTQRLVFEELSCRRTTASFVPDVIAHAILTGDQFRLFFATVLSSTAKSANPDVFGTPKEIYDWFNAWITSDRIMVDVILMEMMDFKRTAPGVPRTEPFQTIHSLRGQQQYIPAALRMVANIATVRGKGIMPRDFHEGNGLATPDGMQLYLIDWGGLFNLNIESDRLSLLSIFNTMCRLRSRTETINATADAALVDPTESENTKRLARFPSLEELCGFLQIGFHDNSQPQHRSQNLHDLMLAFETRLMAVVDFTCVQPTLENVHSALTMVAFVDFMTNLMIYNHPYCQCGNVLKVVYPDQNVSVHIPNVDIDVTPFDDFRLFLSTFQVGSVPSNTRLQEVVAIITENVRLCPSACAAMPKTELRPSWMTDPMQKEAIRRIEDARRAQEEKTAKQRGKAAAKAAKAAKANEPEARTIHAPPHPRGVVKPAAVAAPTSWVSRLSTALNPMRWFKKGGGTRKQCKQHKQRKSFTKRRHT